MLYRILDAILCWLHTTWRRLVPVRREGLDVPPPEETDEV